MSGLRTDERQWLIYDDESMGAVVRGLEAFALSVTGQRLERHSHIAVRAIGSMMVRMGEQRGHEMFKADGAQRVVMQHMSRIGHWLAGKGPEPVDALDEMHAVVFRLDSRATSAGMAGPGTHRVGVRGD